MRWNNHFDVVIAKVSKRLFLLRFMKKSGAPPNIMLKAYQAFIQPLLLYGYPVFCNAPKYLLSKLQKLESRALRLANSSCTLPPFVESGNRRCEKLMAQICAQPDHPLRGYFPARDKTRTNACSLRAPFAKTKRFYNSFIRFL